MTDRIRPADAAACARAVAESAAASRSLRVRGAGTKDYLGEVLPADAVLDTTALAGVVAHVPGDLTVTVAAGTRFAEVRTTLARADQFMPVDPPHADAQHRAQLAVVGERPHRCPGHRAAQVDRGPDGDGHGEPQGRQLRGAHAYIAEVEA